ncbi:hypothetical protein DQ04_02031090 [Trypanosoma grayi]|uniref:hypothetical protein n=1 Tax=Trypanosoma grayi TaxID=71804 RepID=UPI0004F44830|nr:hypothetical protein DQ04_02031090 [Trypanosoma grayi]KEG12067.1 hypothetical protein DQ04_02031090 [Trypanosoma grayi]
MSTSTVSPNAQGAAKKYPPPDNSKSYTHVPRRKIPPKGYIGCILSKIQVELGLNVMEPMEQVGIVAICIILALILLGIPSYLLYYLYNSFAA